MRKRQPRINPRIAVIQALSAARQALLKTRMQIRRIRILAGKDESARSMLESLYAAEALLERVVLRLETISVAGIVTREGLDIPLRIVRWMSENTKGLPPDVSSVLSFVDEALSVAYAGSGLGDADVASVMRSDHETNADVEEIIREAYSIASLRLKEKGQDEI